MDQLAGILCMTISELEDENMKKELRKTVRFLLGETPGSVDLLIRNIHMLEKVYRTTGKKIFKESKEAMDLILLNQKNRRMRNKSIKKYANNTLLLTEEEKTILFLCCDITEGQRVKKTTRKEIVNKTKKLSEKIKDLSIKSNLAAVLWEIESMKN